MFHGSGFAVYNGEYILTCAHVVKKTNIVNIQLISKTRYRGEVTDIDESIDLAIIKLQIPNGITIKLSPFKFEDCTTLDPVVAIGSPNSLQDSVTKGIISNLRRPGRREIGLNENIEYMQHDAIINPGNSGGPLVNPVTCNVIAVNSNGKPGLSFGIPATVAEKFI